MKVAITGGSGFVGTHLGRYILSIGHEVTAWGSRSTFQRIDHPGFRYMSADTTRPGAWQETVADADLVFNLAGRNIFQRWSGKYKRQIYDSRVLTTRHLVDALSKSNRGVLISTSAVGFYGDCGDTELTESSPLGKGFLAEVARDWEAEAMAAATHGIRVVIARFGVVLGADGGALSKMLPAFRSFVGGPLGDGQQWLPWVHIEDLVAALWFLASNSDCTGPYNMCAPHPVRNGVMASMLGKTLGRPAVMPVPAFMLKMMMGELSGVLLGSQRALPARLQAAGFEFRFSELEPALKKLVRPNQ